MAPLGPSCSTGGCGLRSHARSLARCFIAGLFSKISFCAQTATTCTFLFVCVCFVCVFSLISYGRTRNSVHPSSASHLPQSATTEARAGWPRERRGIRHLGRVRASLIWLGRLGVKRGLLTLVLSTYSQIQAFVTQPTFLGKLLAISVG